MDANNLIWRATLSNDEHVLETDGDPSSWRRLFERCKTEGLKVKALGTVTLDRTEDLAWPSTATHFFVFHDILTIMQTRQSMARKGLACLYLDDHGRQKVKVFWHGGKPTKRLYGEIGTTKEFPVGMEIAIAKS